MKNIKGEELDEFFKSGLASGESSEVDEDWDRMKLILLKYNRKKKFAGIFLISSGIAAMLIISSVLFFNLYDPSEEIGSLSNTKLNEEEIPVPITAESIGKVTNDPIAQSSKQNYSDQPSTSKSEYNYLANKIPGYIPQTDSLPDQLHVQNDMGMIHMDSIPVIPLIIDAAEQVVNLEGVFARLEPEEDTTSEQSTEKISRLSIGITAAQDFTGVNNLSEARMSNVFGLSVYYKLSDAFSIEGGLAYGNKVYGTDFTNYRPNSSYVFRVQPINVSAICEVIDLQLNMGYKLLERNNSSVSLSTGLSSYLMLKENYHFYYENQLNRGPSRYRVENQNKHLFGVANFAVSYQQRLLNNIRLSFSPYVKIPLTKIGYGNVNLQSGGFSIGVISNLKSNP